MPKELQPAHFAAFRRPVVLLVMSLYGHPDAGGYWQLHRFKVITDLDFVEIEGWPSLFWNPETRVLIIA